MERSKVKMATTAAEVDQVAMFNAMPIEFLEPACAMIETYIHVFGMPAGLATVAAVQTMALMIHTSKMDGIISHGAVYKAKGFTSHFEYARLFAEHTAEPCDCEVCRESIAAGRNAMRAYGYDPYGSNAK
jgi:hypothetical protein